MNRYWVLALALVVTGVPAARAATEDVTEGSNSFTPSQTEISVGDRVVWTNKSTSSSHSVTFRNGPDLHPDCEVGLLGNPSSGCQGPGETAQHTFTAAGTFPYSCKVHQGMAGVVVVSAAATTTTTAAGSSTTATTRPASTTTRLSTSSTTATTRPLATSSTLASSSTTSTTVDGSSVLLPGDPPPIGGENSSAAGSGGSDDGGDTATVALIVALLLAASAGGGYLLWRLRPGRA